jgi:bifunctional UDP-N-acetylglucosamine pyrophosphorylase/glucosamine-1-phosphate N-acetyltransferase
MKRALVIPAAGLGTRLGSPLPKALTLVAGQPMIGHVLDRCAPYVDCVVVVVNPAARRPMIDYMKQRSQPFAVTEQAAPTGMLDAILQAHERVAHVKSRVWIAWCDQVLLSDATLQRVVAAEALTPEPAAVVPTTAQPAPYIHFDRDEDGRLIGVRQRREQDPMPDVGESDSGMFSLSWPAYDALRIFKEQAARGHSTGEVNFLPFLPWLAAGHDVRTVPVADAVEAHGINTPDDLAFAEARLRRER